MTHHTMQNRDGLSGIPQSPANRRKHSRARPVAHWIALATIAPLLIVQGCAKHSKDHFTVGSTKGHYKDKHPIVLDEQEQVFDLPIGSSSYEISRPNASAIEGFARAYKRSANGTFSIMLPQGSPNEGAASSLVPDIIKIVENVGVPRNRISTVSYYAGEHGTSAPIRLSYGAVRAQVGSCGKWDADLSDTTQNRNYSNFGCATQQNFAAMLANPADLVAPRGQSPQDAARRAGVIDSYRGGEETVTRSSEFNIEPTSVFE